MTTLARLMLALAIATGSLLTAHPAPAHACGGYVRLPAEEVLDLTRAALADDPGARIEALRWRDDGRAEVEVRWATDQPDVELGQHLVFAAEPGGGWAAAIRSAPFMVRLGAARSPSPRPYWWFAQW